MTALMRRRTAMCGGAVVLALGAGMVVVPAANADTGLGNLGNALSGTTNTVLPVLSPVVNPVVTTVVNPVTTALDPVLAPVTAVVPTTSPSSSLLDPLVTVNTSNGLDVGLVNGQNGSLVDLNLGGTTTGGSGVGTGSGGVNVGGTVGDTVGGLLDGLTGGGTGTGGTGSGTGGLSGGDVVVNIGGSGGVSTGTPQVVVTTVPGATTTTPVPGPTVTVNTTTPAETPAAPAPASTTTAPAPAATSAIAHLVSLVASPSIGTVYPVKDGYRDDVVFRVAGATSTGKNEAVTGTAVLKRGAKQVATWTIGRSTQDLRWNGLDGGKVVPGTYVLTAVVKDASGVTHTTTSKVTASKQRLVAATQRVNALSVSGKHVMAASARSGLSKGRVTLRVTTVATKVQGKQSLYIVKNGKKLTIPIRKGNHTSKAITVPAAFTNFTLQHTWKKGQVKLKSIRYTYSYQTLR